MVGIARQTRGGSEAGEANRSRKGRRGAECEESGESRCAMDENTYSCRVACTAAPMYSHAAALDYMVRRYLRCLHTCACTVACFIFLACGAAQMHAHNHSHRSRPLACKPFGLLGSVGVISVVGRARAHISASSDTIRPALTATMGTITRPYHRISLHTNSQALRGPHSPV